VHAERPRRRWNAGFAHDQLCDELQMPPWRWPCIPRNPYPPNSPGAREWRPDREAQELRDQLDKARRAAVVATASSAQEEGTDAESVVDEGPSA
jgi:hypothetical protein